MSEKFKVNSVYRASVADPIKIERRTDKTVWVVDPVNNHRWTMIIREDDDGTEYVVDYAVPKKHRDMFTWRADEEIEW